MFHSLRATVSMTLKATPGGLAFYSDMLLNVPLISDWQAIQKHREKLFNKYLLNSNKKRTNYDYCVGQKILKYNNSKIGKLASNTTGTFEIKPVHTNGTVTIGLCTKVSERLNI